jgi:hypothetical protein
VVSKIELEIESVKGLREDLCVVQSALAMYPSGDQSSRIQRIQALLDQLDIMRPLGSDGNHGNRHTEVCGCDLPELTAAQEIDIMDRIISGLPARYTQSAEGTVVYKKKLVDSAFSDGEPIPEEAEQMVQAYKEATHMWERIPDFDNYEINPLGVIRSRWTKRVLEVSEDGGQAYVDMHDKDGFSHIVNVSFIKEQVFG